jgi:hypothetical protein
VQKILRFVSYVVIAGGVFLAGCLLAIGTISVYRDLFGEYAHGQIVVPFVALSAGGVVAYRRTRGTLAGLAFGATAGAVVGCVAFAAFVALFPDPTDQRLAPTVKNHLAAIRRDSAFRSTPDGARLSYDSTDTDCGDSSLAMETTRSYKRIAGQRSDLRGQLRDRFAQSGWQGHKGRRDRADWYDKPFGDWTARVLIYGNDRGLEVEGFDLTVDPCVIGPVVPVL